MKKALEIEELRAKSKSDLFKELKNAEHKLFELRFGAHFKKIKNFHDITNLRKKIARIWTILAEKSLNETEKIK